MFNAREASWTTVALFALVQISMSIAINYGFSVGVANLTTLSANLLNILIVVVGILFVFGGLRPRDVGLEPNKILGGVLFTFVLWLVMQALVLGIGAANNALSVTNNWAAAGFPSTLNELSGEFFGNALYEEIAFRGFLFIQLFHKFAQLPHWLALTLALTLSQLFFALQHLPNRMLLDGISLADFPEQALTLLVLGLMLACVYLLTGNLFAAVGTHALNNVPMLLIMNGQNLLIFSIFLLVPPLLAWLWNRILRQT